MVVEEFCLSCKVAIFHKAAIMAQNVLWGGLCKTTGQTDKAKACGNWRQEWSHTFNQSERKLIGKDNKAFNWELLI